MIDIYINQRCNVIDRVNSKKKKNVIDRDIES